MILLVDDDPSVTASLALLLKQHGYRSAIANTPEEAMEKLRSDSPELVIQDMNFTRRTTGEEGLELLSKIRAQHSDLPVILITAWGSIELAVQGMKRGANDFITKPWSNAQVVQAVDTALGLAKAKGSPESAPSRAELDERYDFSNIIGSDAKLVRILDVVGRIAPTDASV